MAKFNAACENNAHKPRPKIMLLRHTYVADSEADAQLGAEQINRFYNFFGAWFMNKKPIVQGLIEAPTDKEMANNPMFSAESHRKSSVIGEAREVIDRLKFYQALGYDEYAFWTDSGMPFDRKKASLERFIKDVMPAFG